jgi:hypothetical protein
MSLEILAEPKGMSTIRMSTESGELYRLLLQHKDMQLHRKQCGQAIHLITAVA